MRLVCGPAYYGHGNKESDYTRLAVGYSRSLSGISRRVPKR